MLERTNERTDNRWIGSYDPSNAQTPLDISVAENQPLLAAILDCVAAFAEECPDTLALVVNVSVLLALSALHLRYDFLLATAHTMPLLATSKCNACEHIYVCMHTSRHVHAYMFTHVYTYMHPNKNLISFIFTFTSSTAFGPSAWICSEHQVCILVYTCMYVCRFVYLKICTFWYRY